MRFALLLIPVAAACGNYNYNRAALVPHATPRMTTGQPMQGRGQLTLGASSIAHLGDPKKGDDPNAGVEIPGTQLFGALKGGFSKYVNFGFLYENGLDKGAKKINSSQPDVDGGNIHGYGITLDIIIPTGEPRWSVGIGFDAMLWSCPYTEYQTFEDGSFTIGKTGSDSVDTFAASITPSFKLDKDIALFGGLTVRNHPTIDQKGMAMGTVLDDVEVQSGPANYIVSAGIEGSLADGTVLLSAVAYYDISRDPAKYGPGMGMMISLPFGRRHASQPQQPPPGYIYTPQPQPYGPQPYPQPYPPPPQPYPAPQPYPPPAAPQPAPPETAPEAPPPPPPQ